MSFGDRHLDNALDHWLTTEPDYMSQPDYPTPPVIGTKVRVLPHSGHPAYTDTVIGFDPSDGAVFLSDGEIVANHLGDDYAKFEEEK
jgi:hypothetical protein